ncbi:MAG: protein-disulfide reductase DsbD family protein [Comamonas sp.]|uniref:prolipoprotein diacylglyceryl transferase family protein n=1 Tax=Comamonas sp. TaxID=34028 RepID=UPI002FC9FCEE
MRPRLYAAIALLLALLLTGATAWAQPLSIPSLNSQADSAQGDVLSAEQAFVLLPPALGAIKTEDKTKEKQLTLNWQIAPGYYLYRDQIRISDAQGQSLNANIPQGETLTDAFFGTVQVFHQQLTVQAALPTRPEQWPLQLQWQGCAEIGVCYPPQQASVTAQQLRLSLDAEPENAEPVSATHWLALPPSVLLGPVALPTMALIVFMALFTSQWWARRQQLRSGQPVESALLQATIAGLLGARLAYVAQWWPEYWGESMADDLSGLLRMLDIRDGGWNLWAGVLAALLWALWRSRKQAALRRDSLQALAVGALIVIAGHAMRTWPATQNMALPNTPFVNAAAQTVDLSRYKGQPLVINLWASWCPPCKREMPVMAQAQKEHPGVRFIWINQGEDAAKVMRYLQTMPLPAAQVLLDPQQLASQHWQQRGLPSTYFYDASGQLKGMRMGELSRASLAEQLRVIAPREHSPDKQ